jgi:DNA polymerase-3 subunit gamma/tau
VDRLTESGVDLTEFMAGAAEALRGLLMLQVGAEPEDMTEALRSTLEGYRSRLEAGDVLRMLRLLADNEVGIRRSANPRLMVETLLLRWAMLDRIVDLEAVLAGQRGSGAGGQREDDAVSRVVHKAVSGEVRANASAPAGAAPPPPPASRVPGPAAPLASPAVPPSSVSLDAISAAWPAIVAAVRAQSRFLGEALAATEPVALELPWLSVVMREPIAEQLHKEPAKVEEVLSRSLGQPVRLRVTTTSEPIGGSPPQSKRMSDSSLKADRLREFRAKDPALDTAADALDLEIVD